MVRRIIAAVVAVVMAAIGVVLVINYANNADERALEGMDTDDVYIATRAIPMGTEAADLGGLVESRAVPRQYQVEGAINDVDLLEGRIAVNDIAIGEQLQGAQFVTPEELRARDEFDLPEEAEDLHQVTIPLDTARALGGNIAAGDTVGVIMSFDATFEPGLYVDDEGNVQWNPDTTASSGEDGSAGEGTIEEVSLSFTKLALEKVLVTQVRGAYVPQPKASVQEDEDTGSAAESEGPADQILVTLALEGGQSEQLVYAMEFGTVWLTYEPETAEEDDDDIKVIRLPERAGDVLE